MAISYENSKFRNSTVDLDGASFKDCTFHGCSLRYSGGVPPTMVACDFYESRFEFAGAAANTVGFMRGIYHGMGEGGRKIIEATFDSIRDRRAKSGLPELKSEPVDG